MAQPERSGFATDFKRFFLRGLATLLPTVLTIVLLVKCFEFVQQNISVHLTNGIVRVVVLLTEQPVAAPGLSARQIEQELQQRRQEQFRQLSHRWNHGPHALAGFILAIALVYIAGRLLASYLGRKLWHLFERSVQQVPLFKQVYPYVKQVTDFLFSEKQIEFSRVVAVPYPRQGIYSVGLVTGAGFRHVAEATRQQYLTVFIPSSPTPVTGYVIYVKKDEVIDLPITIEEALRFTISGGVIVPAHQELPGQLSALVPGATPEGPGPSPRKTDRQAD